MLKVNKLNNGKYVCCQCRAHYDIEGAWYKRGNHYFCSRECVLAYESELNDPEKIREGE